MIATAGVFGIEFRNELERRVRVVDVVVGEFLALQLLRVRDARTAPIGNVERRRLMRVLAVAQSLTKPTAEGTPLGRD